MSTSSSLVPGDRVPWRVRIASSVLRSSGFVCKELHPILLQEA